MRSQWFFDGLDDDLKTRRMEYWERKRPRLEKLLSHYHDEFPEIHLTVRRHHQAKRTWFEIRAVIYLPTGTLVGESSDRDPMAGLDQVADALSIEIKRQLDLVRKDYLFKRKARQRADLSAAGPLLERDAEAGRRADFFRLLRPHLSILKNHARRELRILELEGLLHSGEVTLADLLDEVLVRAWERFAERPRRLALHLWLIDSMKDILEAWIKTEPRPHALLKDRVEQVLPDEVPQVGEQEWWIKLLGDEGVLTLEDLIPDLEATEAWEQLTREEQRDRLLSLLCEPPGQQREAFLLHALEDDHPSEIAMLQDRPESQVRADIEAARQRLKDRLRAGGFGQESVPVATSSGAAPS